jgi:hypothetical protein
MAVSPDVPHRLPHAGSRVLRRVLARMNVRIAYASSAKNMDYSSQKRWDRELAEYRDLKAQGIQPGGSTRHHLDKAKAISDATGKPFQG